MDENLKQRLDTQDEFLAKIYKSTEKTRKYFLWTLIISLVLFVLPLIGLMFAIPTMVNTLTSGLSTMY